MSHRNEEKISFTIETNKQKIDKIFSKIYFIILLTVSSFYFKDVKILRFFI